MNRIINASVLTVALALASAGEAAAQGTQAPVDKTPYAGAKNRFGILGGANYNMVGVGGITLPTGQNAFFQSDITDGNGWGPYLGAMYEYNSGGLLGFQARVSWDDRRATLNDNDNGITIDSRLAYITVEPALRLNLGSPDFHLNAGPSLSINMMNHVGSSNAAGTANFAGEFEGINDISIGLWGGLGYDIGLSSATSPTKWYLTPFVEGSWMMDQLKDVAPDNATIIDDDNVDDQLSTVTIRAGLQLKFGSAPPVATVAAVQTPAAPPVMNVSLRAPERLVANRVFEETFPLRNYIFFEGSDLPSKYSRIDATQAAMFNEASLLEIPSAGAGVGSQGMAERSARQMSVYYNGVNIFASRLKANPGTNITLNGAGSDAAEGQRMAQQVKDYMVNTFGIDAARIAVRGSVMPKNASGTSGTPSEDLALVREENRRVEVLSDSPAILKPVKIRTVETGSTLENDLVMNINADRDIDTWNVTIDGDNGTQSYGPFSDRQMTQRINAEPLLREQNEGMYTATVTARTRDGHTLTDERQFRLVREQADASAMAQRYSILFEYDESQTVQTYETFLRNEVAPNVPNGATVYIHGHTDRIGLDEYNMDLSARRSKEARDVLQNELQKLGRTVTFESYGYGETDSAAPFNNDRPEGRYYNRTVVMEVVPR